MPRPPDGARGGTSAAAGFATTRWSLVLEARGPVTPRSREALSALCGAYWYPLYAYVRRQGQRVEEAQDLTQEFFARLLEKDGMRGVRPERGKFRAYLLGALKHFLSNERDRARARKRGGGASPLSLELDNAEGRYGLEPVDRRTPEKLFEREWALALLEAVLTRLRGELARAGKGDLFERLKGFLAGEKGDLLYREAGTHLGMSEGAVKVAVHRLRRRYRELLKEEVSQTLADPAEVEDEIRCLFAALGE